MLETVVLLNIFVE